MITCVIVLPLPPLFSFVYYKKVLVPKESLRKGPKVKIEILLVGDNRTPSLN